MTQMTPMEDPQDDKLAPGDVLVRAIEEWRDVLPERDLWPAIASRIGAPSRRVSLTWSQLALAASLLVAVSAGLTWRLARVPASEPVAQEQVVRAESESNGTAPGGIQPANFADEQYDAAVTDLEQLLRTERNRLDPRTVMVIERNLQTIDDAIREAREALAKDPANTYLNSHLADARRRKLDLLRRATTLTPTGGD